MAASEKMLVHREDAFPNLIPHQDLRPMAAHEESNYVDLELHGKLKRTHWNPSTETVQESELGNQMDSGPKDRVANSEKASSDVGANHADCTETQDLYYGITPGMLEAQSPGIDPSSELDLNGKSESDDDATVVLSDHGTPEVHEDESHYITTHEIQLLELDHEVDYDVETGSSWDVEDDHQVYSFVDYAFFDCDETTATKRTSHHGHADTSAAAVSNLHDNGKEPSATKNPNTAGQIHLSIKATSRAVKHPSDIRGKHPRDKSRRGEKASDNATCFIAVPGRVHFGKPKGKDLNDYSSGASSAVSELDDADKEVRNLTARAFRSLACPYFDAIHFSASSESSASDHGRGINGWSTFVDLKYENPNTSSGRDQRFRNGPASKEHFAQKRDGITGLTLTGMRAPPVEIFALNGNLLSRQNASSTTKKFELMGKFSQGQNGVIRLCETLNFRCNVKSGPGNARLNKCAGGSSSTDEVSNTLPSARGSDPIPQPCNPGETMDDTHKKAIFASSLLKNVISKKMQFEQERKMERGEIRETHAHEHEAQREKGARGNPDGLQRQSSRFSEADSDRTIVSVDELGDIVDGNASDAKEERLSLESTDEAARGSKNGTSEAARGTLPRSQNSAFRSWGNGELGFQSEHKNDQTHGGGPATPDGCPRGTDVHVDTATCTHTKMSRLFVPSIRRPSGEGESGTPNVVHSGETEVRANALYVSDAARKSATSKSPEMKRSVRSIRGNKGDPFNIAKLLTPDIGCQKKTADDSRCHALAAAFKGESGDKVPHFIVRDIRDNKGKLQTPIHQVRDVRKLVKSSYHFVSLDAQDRCALLTSEGEHKTVKQSSCLKSASVSPIVIKCQSVNTNSNIKQSGNLIDPSKRRLPEDGFENDASSPRLPIEGPKNPSTPVSKPGSRLSSDNPKQEVPSGSRMEASAQKQDSVGEKKTDTKMANQAALEKLQAAVKTMEQLYVFDKKEWKRKKEPHRVEDSHLLSLIASEEHGATSEESQSTTVSAPTANADKLVRQDSNIENTSSLGSLLTQSEMAGKRGHNDTPETSTTPIPREEENGSEALVQPTGTLGKSTTLNHFQKPFATASSLKAVQTNVSSPTATCSKVVAPKSQKLPVCLKISKAKHATEKRERPNGSEREFAPLQFTSTADAESYLTIPVKPQATSAVKPSTSGLGKTAIYTTPATGDKTASPPYYLSHSKVRGHREIHQSQKRSSIVMETRSPDTPTATIYHTSLPVTMQASQPQVICFSPTVQPSPVPTEHFQHTQRKMLLDPTTGNYYLVDTPVHPATRRLFDPETGQYVDIPMPQPSPMTPVPMPISPLALSPGAYGPTYMFYPGYMPTTMIPAHTVQSQLSMQSEADEGNKSCSHIGQQEDGAYMESPYYMPTGKSSQTTSVAQHITTSRLASSKQPIISITSQQGPRIIAPPSFDGTTMSFVVEHR